MAKQRILLFLTNFFLGHLSTAQNLSINLGRNDGPSFTLFKADIDLAGDSVFITASGIKEHAITALRRPTKDAFESLQIELDDEGLQEDFRTVVRYFELCDRGLNTMRVSGGIFTTVTAVPAEGFPAATSHYILVDESKRRAVLTEKVAHQLHEVARHTEAQDDEKRAKALALLKKQVADLAARCSRYQEARDSLNRAYHEKTAPNWRRIGNLVRLRQDLPKPAGRTKLVRQTQRLLSKTFSQTGIESLFHRSKKPTAIISTVPTTERIRGDWDFSKNYDHGFDDYRMSVGLELLPSEPAVPVAVLELGLERLLVDFVVQEIEGSSNAADFFSLFLRNNRWQLARKRTSRKTDIPESASQRLEFLSDQSQLIETLLGKEIAGKVALVGLNHIRFQDDQWTDAKIDYAIDGRDYVMPFFNEEGEWMAHTTWTRNDFYSAGNTRQNSEFFRSREEVTEHDQKRVE